MAQQAAELPVKYAVHVIAGFDHLSEARLTFAAKRRSIQMVVYWLPF